MQLPPQQNFTKGQDLVIGCQVDEAEIEEVSFKLSVLNESKNEDLCSIINSDTSNGLSTENSAKISMIKQLNSTSSPVDNIMNFQINLVETNISPKKSLDEKNEELILDKLKSNEKLEETKNLESDVGDPVDAEEVLIKSCRVLDILNDDKIEEFPSKNENEGK